MPASKADFEQVFPLLGRDGFDITSPEDVRYNCIAYACSDVTQWWWPNNRHGHYWPPDVPKEETLAAFEALFKTLGYRRCATGRLQHSFQRVAIFELSGVPTHATLQLENGHWSSKIGKHEDIDHASLTGLEQSEYGTVALIMRRRRKGLKMALIALVERLFA